MLGESRDDNKQHALFLTSIDALTNYGKVEYKLLIRLRMFLKTTDTLMRRWRGQSEAKEHRWLIQ